MITRPCFRVDQAALSVCPIGSALFRRYVAGALRFPRRSTIVSTRCSTGSGKRGIALSAGAVYYHRRWPCDRVFTKERRSEIWDGSIASACALLERRVTPGRQRAAAGTFATRFMSAGSNGNSSTRRFRGILERRRVISQTALDTEVMPISSAVQGDDIVDAIRARWYITGAFRLS